MKFKRLFAFLLAAPLFLGSCIKNNGLCYTHIDNNKDGICDVCGAKVKIDGGGEGEGSGGDIEGNPCSEHVDKDLDGVCDVCGSVLSSPEHDHVDADQDGHCDICNATMIICNNHYDANGDGKCDNCGAEMPHIEGDVTVYLVLSSVGLYNGAKGTTYSEVNVEYAVKFIKPVGTALPDKTEITHLYQTADFSGWVAYEGEGAPTVYTVVPASQNKILYAQFTPNGNAPVDPGTDDPVTPATMKDYVLQTNFEGGNWSADDAKIYVYTWGGEGSPRAYECSKVDANTFNFSIADYYTDLLFMRVAPDVTFNPDVEGAWSNKWDQSEDLHIDSSKTTAKITCWDNNGSGKSGVTWVA